jgi:hypothetical protein
MNTDLQFSGIFLVVIDILHSLFFVIPQPRQDHSGPVDTATYKTLLGSKTN